MTVLTSRALTYSFGLQIMVLEGLHPFYDERVRELYDFRIYLDISDEVKFAWKIQRDMKERGHSLESIKASIEARRPDFDAYIDPQKKHADVIIQVPTFICALDAAVKNYAVTCLMQGYSQGLHGAGGPWWWVCPESCVRVFTRYIWVCRCCRRS